MNKLLQERNAEDFSEGDLRYIEAWVDYPELVNLAKHDALRLKDNGGNPSDYWWFWAATINSSHILHKSKGVAPSHVYTPEKVPVIVIDLSDFC